MTTRLTRETVWGRSGTTREEVYRAIDSERAYQFDRWNESTTTTNGHHARPEEWLVYLHSYVSQGMEQVSREPDQVVFPKVMDTIRKIAALAVAAMEDLGAPRREGY